MRHIFLFATLFCFLTATQVIGESRLVDEKIKIDLGLPVSNIVFSGNGQFIAFGGYRGEVKLGIWDRLSRKTIFEIKLDRQRLEMVKFSPSSRICALAVSNSTITEIVFIDTKTRQEVGRYSEKAKLNPRIEKSIVAIAFSPDEQTLAISQLNGDKGSSVKLLDIRDLSKISIKDSEFFSSFATVGPLAFSPDGTKLAFVTTAGSEQDNGRIFVVGLAGHKVIMNSKNFDVGYGIAFSQDNGFLIASGMTFNDSTKSHDTYLIFYEASTLKETNRLNKFPAGESELIFSSSGRLLASAREDDDGSGYNIRIIETKSVKSVTSFSSLFGSLTAMGMSPDGKVIAIGNEKGQVEIKNTGL